MEEIYYILQSEGFWEDHVEIVVDDVFYTSKEQARQRLDELNDGIDLELLEGKLPIEPSKYLAMEDEFADYCDGMGEDYCEEIGANDELYWEEMGKRFNYNPATLKQERDILDEIDWVETENPRYEIHILKRAKEKA